MTDIAIEIRNIREVHLKGGVVFDGFPSIGLANTIASECLIQSQKAELVAILDSTSFPALSVVRGGRPGFPARVYANEAQGLAVFVSELILDPSLHKPVANKMFDWAQQSGCELFISAAGVPYESQDPQAAPQVYAVCSTKHASEMASAAGIVVLENGSVSGIPAVLLNEGSWRNIDVIVLMVRVLKDAPDFRAGAAVAETLSKLLPSMSCDVGSLLRQAEITEMTLKKIMAEQAASSVGQQEMYG